MCNVSLSWTDRVNDIVGRLDRLEKMALIQGLAYPTEFNNGLENSKSHLTHNTRLNIKSFYWDMVCTNNEVIFTGYLDMLAWCCNFVQRTSYI